MADLYDKLAAILATEDPAAKAERARALLAAGPSRVPDAPPARWPDPARRSRPPLLAPREMPRRRPGSLDGRRALLHAVAHIELNAIDLAADMAGRFAHDLPPGQRQDFVADWLSVMDDEARHFTMVAARLDALGIGYGDLPAHDGLFEAARDTAHDILARLAIAPLVFEARGLDVTPGMITRLRSAGDTESGSLLERILEEEVGHVGYGVKWFTAGCARRGLDPATTFAALVRRYHPGGLKRPFNVAARQRSGLETAWYLHLASGNA